MFLRYLLPGYPLLLGPGHRHSFAFVRTFVVKSLVERVEHRSMVHNCLRILVLRLPETLEINEGLKGNYEVA